MTDKVIYEWGLYANKGDDHFEFQATPQQIAEALPNPDVSIRLIRYASESRPDGFLFTECYVDQDGTFESNGYFDGGHGTKVPKRYVEQLARWVAKHGCEDTAQF